MANPQLAKIKKASHWDREKLLAAMDATDASALIWQGLRDGAWGEFREYSGDMRGEHQLLLKYPQAATTDDWIRMVTVAGRDPGGHLVRDWSNKADEAFRLALAHDRAGLLGRVDELSQPLRLQLEATRMTTGEPDAASDACLDAIAAAYLGESSLYDTHWVVKHRDALPKERLARAVVRQLPSTRGARNWSVVEDVLPHLSPAETVALLVRYEQNDWRSRLLDGVRALPDPRGLLEAELASLRAGSQAVARQHAGYALAHLLVDAGEAIPEAIDTDLGHFSGGDHEPALDQRLFAALPPARAAAIAKKSLFGNRHLLAVIDDEGLLDAAVDELERAYDNRIAEALGDVGERALGPLERGAEGKPPAKRASQIAIALGRIRTSGSAALLVELLGHSSKVVRDAAQKALGDHGPVAKAAIAAGAKAKKKAVRVACQELLELLSAAEALADTPLGALEAEAAKLDDATREQIRTFSEHSHAWPQEAAAKVDAHGPVVAVELRDWFLEQFARSDHYATETYLAIVRRLRGRDAQTGRQTGEPREEDALAAAYAVLDAVARLPKMKKYKTRSLERSLPRTFQGWAAEAAASALRSRKTPLAESLYQVAAQDAAASKDVLVAGLGESGKGVRAICVEALGTLGEAVVDDVLPSLAAKKKDEREAAAKVLAAVGSPKAADALARALEGESSEDARLAIEDAIRACGGAPAPSPESPASAAAPTDATSGGDAASWEAQLTAGKKPRLPKWVDLGALPPLTLAGGEALSDDARAGLVGRLKKEHERPDALAAELAKDLDPGAAATFGEALFEQWQKAGKSKASDKWALYQLGHFASDGWIHETAPRLDGMSSAGRHALAGWHLDVYGRRGSKPGLDWIGFWADNAMTDGLQRKAIAQLKELAEARGTTEKALRAELDPFVADDQAERKVSDLGFDARGEQKVSYGARELTIRLGPDGGLSVVDDAGKVLKSLPKPTPSDDAAAAKAAKEAFDRVKSALARTLKAVIRRFERAMVSGRVWDRARFEEVFLAHPLMSTVGTGLVFGTEDGATFRVSEERTPMDAAGDDVTLPADARVHIVHPLELDADALAAWRQHLEDADVVQPFEQLHRPTFAKGDALALPDDRIPSAAFVGRVRDAGWNRGRPEDAGLVYYDWIRMPARGVTVRLEHSGYAAGGGWDEPVKLEGVHFGTPTGGHLSAEQVDPIAFSEAQYAVQKLFGGKKAQPRNEAQPAAAAPAAKTDASGTTQKALVKMGAGYPSADLAPSARAKCMHCDQKIEKGDVRIVIEREIETPRFTGKGPGYMHPACAVAWADAQGLDVDDFVAKVRANTKLDRATLPEPFDA